MHLRPEDVSDFDLDASDPAHSPTDLSQNCSFEPPDYSIVGTSVGPLILELFNTRQIPLATTAADLRKNILRMMTNSNPLPSLPSFLDYHYRHPGLRSTRSYNILISFSLRHGAFHTAEGLFKAMHADALEADLENWTLWVRLLVRSGRWNQAWKEVHMVPLFRPSVRGKSTTRGQRIILPLPIWLEFLGTSKLGSLKHRVMQRRRLPVESHEGPKILDTEEIQDDYMRTTVARYRTLLKNRPMPTVKEMKVTQPRVVYAFVRILYECQDRDSALSFTKSYLTSLPRKISTSWANKCLDIIHLHIVFGSPNVGLRGLFESRRIYLSLLRLHDAVHPTSTTAFLLLSHLKKVKRCGTIAERLVGWFKKQWGVGLEDRRLRRRVATLAAKEGRMDILCRILDIEKEKRWAHGTWNTRIRLMGEDDWSGRRARRVPMRQIFRYNGREERYWCQFLKRRERRERHLRERGET